MIPFDGHRQQIGAPQELGRKAVRRLAVERLGRAIGDEAAVAQDGDAIGQRQGLGLIVGHVEDRQRRQLAMQPGELVEHVAPDLRVEGGERLVQQQHLRPDRERARDRHALLLSAAELARIALGKVEHPDHAQAFPNPLGHQRLGRPPRPQSEGHVLVDPHVREQRVVLDHHADIAGIGRQRGHIPIADADPALDRLDETGDGTQRRRLAGAGGTDQRDDLAGRNRRG